MVNSFYIHIPFCRQKCPYCKFALTPIFDEAKKRRYIAYLENEIKEYFLKWWNIKTLYFGGWTPSILSHDEIREILKCFPDYKYAEEITLEANPEDITEEYIRWVFDLGINRLSIGIQTLNNLSLKEIHRSNKEDIYWALESIKNIRNKYWKNAISINIDFILWLPYTKKWETLQGIKEIHKSFPFITHTSVYMLEDEKYPKNWKENSLSENEIQKEFLEIMEYFESLRWNHYELSNFAKPWYESIHNKSYWNHSSYRGFWLSASSYEDRTRFTNASSFSWYYEGKVEESEILSDKQIEIEEMMFWLRKNGWSYTNTKYNQWKIDSLILDGIIEIQNKKIRPTKTWIFLLDHIMSELIF